MNTEKYNKEIFSWLYLNAEKVKSELSDSYKWVTKARGDYITLEGMEEKLSYLPQFGITEHISSIWGAGKPINIGFNPKEQKWYGWSHRALYGFGIGSECEKGDCNYQPTDKNDFLEDTVRFWEDDCHVYTKGVHTDKGVKVEWMYDQTTPNESLRGEISSTIQPYPEKYGKGVWVAQTLADARQMAIDFAKDVS